MNTTAGGRDSPAFRIAEAARGSALDLAFPLDGSGRAIPLLSLKGKGQRPPLLFLCDAGEDAGAMPGTTAMLRLAAAGREPVRDIHMAVLPAGGTWQSRVLAAVECLGGSAAEGALVLYPEASIPPPGKDGILFVGARGLRGSFECRFSFRKKAGGTPYYPDNSGILAACELVSRISSANWPGPASAATASLPESFRTNGIGLGQWSGGRKRRSEIATDLVAVMSLLPGLGKGKAEAKAAELAAGLGAELETLSFRPCGELAPDMDLGRLAAALGRLIPGCKALPLFMDGPAGEIPAGVRVHGLAAQLFEDEAEILEAILHALAGGERP